MPPADPLTLKIHRHIAEIPQAVWDGLLDARATPFQAWTWLEALEHSGCAVPSKGWHPHHLTLYRGATLVAAAPAYVRDDSHGEFVFDWAWAGAAQRAGVPYYPKLTLAVPFTPATGPRFLVAPREDRIALTRALGRQAVEFARAARLSSVHVLFPLEDEADALETEGYGIRHGIQFHWDNAGYGTYDEFLARFDSKRRHQLRREAKAAEQQGITLRTRRGDELSAADADQAYKLYVSTVDRHTYGQRYLRPAFFARVLDRFRPHVELVEAVRDGQVIAGAFNVASPTHLYGRYWGCYEDHPFLHFNVCYYHSIAQCIARGVQRFEGGAGGEHKLSRGFEPAVTRSAHWLFHPGLDHAVRDFLGREREAIARELPSIRAAAGLKPTAASATRVE